MPKNTKQAPKKDLKKEDQLIVEEDIESEDAAPMAELDPEILSVLENKKKEKSSKSFGR
ncbi:MAG: hypothetical protein KatS3mg101_0713 [Patescibacteria group bacterium]|nr:MAG: hypothetical protein KatS3mg101_0713 [Patescibacteria group bacterium]